MAELYVYPNAPPVGTIDSIDPSPAEKGDEVTFNGTGADSDGTVVAYLWESSIDGNLSTEEDFSSNGLSLGHHAITFMVQDNDGAWSDAASESLFVFAYPMAIAGQDITVESNQIVQFSGTGTDDDGSIEKYEWDFEGDGVYDLSSGDNGRTTNVYNNEGTYTAVLRVTDNDGFTATDSRVITVSKAGGGGGGDDGGGGEEETVCQNGDTKLADDGCNQCICNNNEWACTEVACDDKNDDDDGFLPAPSLAAAVAAVAVIALRRPRKP
jgi:hypothetical protein